MVVDVVHGFSGFGDLDVEADGRRLKAVAEVTFQTPRGPEQDIPIWENKIYRDRPQLARGEGAITEFRAWSRQSYEEALA